MKTSQSANVSQIVELPTPRELRRRLPLKANLTEHVDRARQTIADIILGRDERFLVIVGPCSIHCADTAREYALRLKKLADEVGDSMFVVMRTYFEKPRTGLGWKGMIYDPELDGTHDIGGGMQKARDILMEINQIGLPCATEWLDPVTPQYISDLIAWSAIGARTVESQIHRQLASGISAPVGFKNGTTGDIQVAVTAAMVARRPHTFIGVTLDGKAASVSTYGNRATHVVLRGARGGPNYGKKYVKEAAELMLTADLRPALLIDCSHGNSSKDHNRQAIVLREILKYRLGDDQQGVIGAMLESNLKAGKQRFSGDRAQLEHGVSITDSCIGWEATEELLLEARQTLGAGLEKTANVV